MTSPTDHTPPKDWKPHPMAWLFSWTEAPGAGRFVMIGLLLICAGLVVADAFTEGHAHFEIENVLDSYGIYGFLSFTFVVLMGWPLRALLGRAPDYYDLEEDAPREDGLDNG